jgi:hypothetical protein
VDDDEDDLEDEDELPELEDEDELPDVEAASVLPSVELQASRQQPQADAAWWAKQLGSPLEAA